MRRTIFIGIIIFGVFSVSDCFGNGGLYGALSDRVRENLRDRIEAAGTPPEIEVTEELIYASVMLPGFYERRSYFPAWSDDNGPLPAVDSLVEVLNRADREGLRSSDYHLKKITEIIEDIRSGRRLSPVSLPRYLADLDLLLTDTFMTYGSHLLKGRVNPQTIDPEWFANIREIDLAITLDSALAGNRIGEALKALLPPQAGYYSMRRALAGYRMLAVAGGWENIPDGPKMQLGDRGERINRLRHRLAASGDLKDSNRGDGDLFDESLKEAVIQFQRRNGLEPDGVVGKETLVTLNIPVEKRIEQIILNMERWRWLPQDLGRRHIIINIANYELDVYESDSVVLPMRVIVGKDYRRTPVFSDKITYMVVNPYWNVPFNIAVSDILPMVKKDPEYLTQQNMKLFQGHGSDRQEIDYRRVDWSGIDKHNFDYWIRQEPGPMNALGRIKFMFPNKFNVYLHDTPARELFSKTIWSFSSGCIRIEKPMELAEYLLRGDLQWNREKLLAAIDMKVEKTIRVPEPVPIHLLYWTAWASPDGTINFRKDIYNRDAVLEEALTEHPPEADQG
nr:L,D-transpeptidase family protein [candidate division Zixibacteria bacterium]